MITANGYALVQYPKKNRIVISIPQRWDTLTDTTGGIPRNRRDVLTAEEEAILLNIVMELYEPHKEEQE